MVIDDEAMGMVARTLRGIEVSDETLSIDVIHSSAIDPGHFLGNPQTLEVMESEYIYPQLMDRSPTDQWQTEGATDLFARSRAKAREVLSTHYPNYFGSDADTIVRSRFPIQIAATDMTAACGRW